MSFKNIIFVLLFSTLALASCKRETDRIFEENATVRVTKAIKDTYEVLQTNKAGWMMKFYPSKDQEFGGYTIFTKFISNAQVSLASDPIPGVETSSYAVVQESGPVLTFNGFNKSIHWFSEPGMDNGRIGADDTGMKGDFEFIVLTASADSVVLKGKKSGSRVVMLPLQEGGFETLSKNYQEAANKFREFGMLQLEDKEGQLHKLVFDERIRVFQNPKDNSGERLSFRVTPEGLEFYKSYVIEGVSIGFLQYRAPTTAYMFGYYTDSANTFKIIPDMMPLNEWFVSQLWSMSYQNVGATGRSYWNTARTNLTNNRIKLDNFYIGTYQGRRGMVYVLQNGTVIGQITHNLTIIPGTRDQVRVSLAGSIYDVVGGFGLPYWTAGLNQLTTPFNNRTFRITADKLSRPETILLTDTALPSNTFRLFLNSIDDPFNN